MPLPVSFLFISLMMTFAVLRHIHTIINDVREREKFIRNFTENRYETISAIVVSLSMLVLFWGVAIPPFGDMHFGLFKMWHITLALVVLSSIVYFYTQLGDDR